MFQTKIAGKIKTPILFSIPFVRKSCLLRDNVEEPCRAGQATGDNTEHVHFMLDTKGYKHTLRIRNATFSTVTMIARTRLNVTLYLHCLLCYLITK